MNFNTVIIRHKKENKKKCSLEPIKDRLDCEFLTYPLKKPLEIENAILLSFEGKELTKEDQGKTLILLDATWKKAEIMYKEVFKEKIPEKRSLPKGFKTAYPRRQFDCEKPEEGLASIEALYIAYLAMGQNVDSLLDGYYWKKQFLEQNEGLITTLLS